MKEKNINLFDKGLYFLPLGGCGKFGMNMGVYAINGKLLVIDMGLSFSSLPGQELLLADPDFLVENKDKIVGVVITHIHEDHIGATPYIMPMLGKVPVYVTPMGKSFLREKLFEFDLQDSINIISVNPGNAIDIADFSVRFVNITHSVPEANALVISTEFGNVVHTGDWNLDPKPLSGYPLSQEDMKRAIGADRSVLALVCDSTNVYKQSPGVRESQVRAELVKLIKSLKGHRVVFSCFSSNITRIESCALAAVKSGRKVGIVGHSIKRIERIAREHGYLKDTGAFLDERKIKSEPSEKTVLICTGSQGERNSALSKLADNSHQLLKLDTGDVVVFSSRVIPGNEKSIIDLQNRLVDKGVRIITSDLLPIHASGHPSREEIKQLCDWVDPSVVIPVHGDLINLFEHAAFVKECGVKNAIVPRNGHAIKLAPGKPSFQESPKFRNGALTVDGNKLVPLDGAIQKDKLRVMRDGIAFVTISETDIKNLPYEICDLTCLGLFEPSQVAEGELIKRDICALFNEMITKRDKSKELSSSIEGIVKSAVRKVFTSSRDKKPVVITHILDLF